MKEVFGVTEYDRADRTGRPPPESFLVIGESLRSRASNVADAGGLRLDFALTP